LSTQQELINNIKKICICRGITVRTINKAMSEGCLSFEALRRQLGTGTGNCKAKRCREKIEKMVKDYQESLRTGV